MPRRPSCAHLLSGSLSCPQNYVLSVVLERKYKRERARQPFSGLAGCLVAKQGRVRQRASDNIIRDGRAGPSLIVKNATLNQGVQKRVAFLTSMRNLVVQSIPEGVEAVATRPTAVHTGSTFTVPETPL